MVLTIKQFNETRQSEVFVNLIIFDYEANLASFYTSSEMNLLHLFIILIF